MNHFITFTGRLHPLIVHLPIGFIMLGLLLQWYNQKKTSGLDHAISIAFLWGGITAVMACITGFILYTKEGFAFDTVKFHLWMGIITALFSFIYYVRVSKKAFHKVPLIAFSVVILALISATGHFGGNITHGEDYLTEPLPASVKHLIGIQAESEKEIALNEKNLGSTILYNDVVQPILNNKCVSCHGTKKAKGDLALHNAEAIQKGGEHGAVINLKIPDSSSLYHRLVLPLDHEDHMPPKEKTQLTKEETALIKVWIANGASYDKSIEELGIDQKLFASFLKKDKASDLPEVTLKAVAKETITAVKNEGFGVQAVSQDTDFLKVSCLNFRHFTDADLMRLKPLFKNILSLDLRGTQITDAIFNELDKLPYLQTLQLDHTQISGKGIGQLQKLNYLRSVSVTHTQFTGNSVDEMTNIKGLTQLYLFNTPSVKDSIQLKDVPFSVDYGNYTLPTVASDTIVY
ncbi:hypothetical protein MQE36_07830 [Zhouia spongiae]|uniref:Cytochrome c domain-containing protein n=1 Tax=Zhouia spongiae TaxID=2202721 RepID=A0ABY3YR99_9FLAO|nr:c-type cytochrome domain-containing protein [Zhouia spongiae]UNZ00242.1 hypothetical protein MQE36_07830 [Zhouia spongiae]